MTEVGINIGIVLLLVILLNITLYVVMTFIAHFIQFIRQFQKPDYSNAFGVEDNNESSVVSEDVYDRERKFNTRVAKLKEEMALKSSAKKRNTSVAEEMHEGVYNIPHEEVDDKMGYLPDVERTD